MTGKQHYGSVSELRKLVYELNILRRHISSYPLGHPLVDQTLQRVHATVGGFIPQTGRLTIGIARTALVLGDDVLEATEPAVRDFSEALFSFGIVSLTFHAGLRPEELQRFNERLMVKPDDAISPESVRGMFDALELEHISIGLIDYGAIQVHYGLLDSIDDSADFWERFVKGVIAGTLSSHSSSEDAAADAEMYALGSPEMLAEMLSEGVSQEKGTTVPALLGLFGRFMQRVDESTISRERYSVAKFLRFLHALKPEVRQYFLESSANALSERPTVAEAFFDTFSNDLLADMLNTGLQKGSSAPPAIMGLLQRLGDLRSLPQPVASSTPAREKDIPEGPATDECLRQKLQVIFREEHTEKFVSQEYSATLHSLLEGTTLTKSEEQDIQRLRETLADHGIEVKVSNIILELLDVQCGDGDGDTLEQNLLDLCTYFVRTGDFAALASIYERTQRREHAEEQLTRLRTAFLQPDFIEEIMQAPVLWGKQKFEDVAVLIRCVGEPFIDPILDRLAEENNISLRRFYVDRLSELGSAAIAKAGARLKDHRWYFVRNLIVILRNIGDVSIVPFIRMLQDHSHPKVRQEVQKTLLHFNDPGALVMLVKDLDDADFDVRMGAIRLAEKKHTPQILSKIESIVETGGFSSDELELKVAAVRTLATVGDRACLPCLERVLRSKNFFRAGALNQLKEQIVVSLGAFSSPEAHELLLQVAAFGSRELAQKAKSVAENIGRNHEA